MGILLNWWSCIGKGLCAACKTGLLLADQAVLTYPVFKLDGFSVDNNPSLTSSTTFLKLFFIGGFILICDSRPKRGWTIFDFWTMFGGGQNFLLM